MAALCSRVLFRIPARNFVTSSSRLEKMLDDTINVVTGIEKRERLAHAAGNLDPFNLEALKRGKGSKDCPNEVPSACDSRIVGCVCEEDSTSINWMWLHQGQPRRCSCGHWFKLVYKAPI